MSNTNLYRAGSKNGVTIGLRYFGPNTLIPAGAMNDRQRDNLLAEHCIALDGEKSAPGPVNATLPPAVGVSEREFWDKNKTADASVGDPQTTSAANRARAALTQLAADREAGVIPAREAASSVEMVRADEPAPAARAPGAPAEGAVWAHDPDGLVGQPIDELRRLVLEVDATIEVDHLDEVELIAVLSSEYVATKS